MVKPPAESGFAWQVLHNVDIGSREVDFVTLIDVASPVPVSGTLSYDGNPAAVTTLEGAEIRAYTIIESETDGERAVEVGKAVVNEDGEYKLLLSPSLRLGLYDAN